MSGFDQPAFYQSIFDHAPAGFGLCSAEEKIIRVNHAWCSLLGYSQQEAQNLSLQDIIQTEDYEIIHSHFRMILDQKLPEYQKLIRYRHKDGSNFWINLSLALLPAAENSPATVLFIMHDIEYLIRNDNNLKDIILDLEIVNDSLIDANREIQEKNRELQTAYQKLEELARTDTLTGLPNRRELEERLEMEAERSERMKHEFSVCICDIDDFKLINDNYGHDIGDLVLKDIAAIFKHSARGTDIVGRWGGEEFMFILPETPLMGALTLMERVRQYVMNHVVKKNEIAFKVTTTIGFSSFLPGSNLEEVVKQADLALYAGKKSGKNLAIKFDKKLEVIHSI